MDDICCDICFIKFDEKKHVPKNLDCGHSFCHLCLNSFLRNGKCPNCTKQFLIRPIEAFSTNYSLLKAVDAFMSFASSSWNSEIEIGKLKKSLIKVQNQLRSHVLMYNEITEAISQLENLNKEYNEQELIETLQKFFVCQKTLRAAENVLKPVSSPSVENCLKSSENDISVDVNLKNINAKEFIEKLVDQMRSGIKFYAVHHFEQKYIFGRLHFDSKYPSMLFMYSLSETEPEDSSKFIWFSDLKKCIISTREVVTFIEAQSPTKILIHLNDTFLSSQFLKICSGESGATYKGAKCNRGFRHRSITPMLSVTEYVVKNQSEGNPVDYLYGLSNPGLQYSVGSVIVEGFLDGGFKIFKVNKDAIYEDIIGCLNEDIEIDFSHCSNIFDCGIAYPIHY